MKYKIAYELVGDGFGKGDALADGRADGVADGGAAHAGSGFTGTPCCKSATLAFEYRWFLRSPSG
jgi:hypothetical protein